jgi:hypothetical protein
MSLASRVANFLSIRSANPSPEERHDFGFADDGPPKGEGSFVDGKLDTEAFRSETMAPKTNEEEGRPPYIHVRLIRSCFEERC